MTPTPKFSIISFVIVAIATGAFCIPHIASSRSDGESFSDFDMYRNGNLNKQNGWSDSWNSLQVQDNIVFSGTRGLKNRTTFEAVGYKELPSTFLHEGVATIKINILNSEFGDERAVFGLYKGETEDFVATVRFGHNFNGNNNSLLLSRAGSTEVIHLGEITQEEWHKIAIAWRQDDYSIRIKVDNNQWTEWLDSQTTWTENESLGIRLTLPPAQTHGDFYIDDLNVFEGTDEPHFDPVLLQDTQDNVIQSDETQTNESTTTPITTITADTDTQGTTTAPF